MLAELEHIDDEADNVGIDFVKINDKKFAKELGVFALPAVVFFKLGSKEPVIYAGTYCLPIFVFFPTFDVRSVLQKRRRSLILDYFVSLYL